jgi:hypothetical protein
MSKLKKGIFFIDLSPNPLTKQYFSGFYNPDERMSFGEVPCFEKAVAEEIINGFNEGQELYKNSTGEKMFFEGETIVFFEADNTITKLEPQQVTVGNNKYTVYEMGLGWVWQALSFNNDLLNQAIPKLPTNCKAEVDFSNNPLGRYSLTLTRAEEIVDTFYYDDKDEAKEDAENLEYYNCELVDDIQESHLQAIAALFSSILKSWLTDEQIEEINALNSSEEYKTKGYCATHDYCDPNVAMDSAFTAITGQDPDFLPSVPSLLEAWQKAWTIARENNFFISK